MASEPHEPPRRDQPPPLPHWPPIAQPMAPVPEIASVPRRYGPGTLLVVTTAYALLFSGFRVVGGDQAWWIGAAVFLTGIGIAQMIGGPANARPASMIAGVILLPMTVIVAGISLGISPDQDSLLALACSVILGVPAGYVGGVLVGGVFLVMRYADAAISGVKGRGSEAESTEAEVVDGRWPDDHTGGDRSSLSPRG